MQKKRAKLSIMVDTNPELSHSFLNTLNTIAFIQNKSHGWTFTYLICCKIMSISKMID